MADKPQAAVVPNAPVRPLKLCIKKRKLATDEDLLTDAVEGFVLDAEGSGPTDSDIGHSSSGGTRAAGVGGDEGPAGA